MSKLVVSSIGPACSVQDGGRHGAERYGLAPSGAMDRLALAMANTLLGNDPFAAAVELGPFGATFTARDSAVVAVLKGPRPRHCQVSRPGRLAPATMEATCELIVPAPAWMWDRGGALRAQSLME